MYKGCSFVGYDYGKLYGSNLLQPSYYNLTIEIVKTVEELYELQGVTEFYSDGVTCFDIVAFRAVELVKKSKGLPLKNIVIVPSKDYDSRLSGDFLESFNSILNDADDVRYNEDKYSQGVEYRTKVSLVGDTRYCVSCKIDREIDSAYRLVKQHLDQSNCVININPDTLDTVRLYDAYDSNIQYYSK